MIVMKNVMKHKSQKGGARPQLNINTIHIILWD